jgi:hypothetical protein
MALPGGLVRALVVLTVVLTSSAEAAAQGWLPGRGGLEGPGLRVGRLEIHPGIAAELGYENNVFLEDDDPDASLILRMSGHADVATLGSRRRTEGEAESPSQVTRRMLDFRGGVGASYYEYFGTRARRNVELDLGADAIINPDGRYSVRIADQYARTIRPFIDATPEGGRAPTYVRNNNNSSLTLSMGSRSGLLQGVVGYDLAYEGFRDETFDYLDNLTHRIHTRVSWRFLPQTAIVQRNEVDVQQYLHPSDGPLSLVANGTRVSSVIGVNGVLTQKISVTASGGYSVGFYRVAEEYESWNAQAEGRFRMTERILLSLGYFRRYNPSYIGNFVKSDRIYLNAQYLVEGRLLLRAETYVSFDETGIALLSDGVTPLGSTLRRSDIRFRGVVSAEYRFASWIAIMTTLSYRHSTTDYQYASEIPGPDGALPDPAAGYSAFDGWLGVRAFY